MDIAAGERFCVELPDAYADTHAAPLLCAGVVVCAGIHMSTIPAFDYSLLGGERELKSVANLTRGDALAFTRLLQTVPVTTHVTTFPLARAQAAIDALRAGTIAGAAVLVP
jgi:propanol-preferring alcohol dehydrogenase